VAAAMMMMMMKLLGGELNAETEREAAALAGHPRAQASADRLNEGSGQDQ
jgi:hypothetical protein